MTPGEVATAFFECLNAKDVVRLRTLLADDLRVSGPLGTRTNADDYRDAQAEVLQLVDAVSVVKMFVDGADVLTWFEFHLVASDSRQSAVNWSHIEDGKVRWIRVVFDPRFLFEPDTGAGGR